MRRRSIDPLAVNQLQQWQKVARGWPVSFVMKETGLHLSCAVCGQTALPVTDAITSYQVDINMLLAQVVAHLRNVHRDIESEVYAGDRTNGREDTQAATSD